MKKILTALLAIMVILSLSGCNKKTSGNHSPTPETTPNAQRPIDSDITVTPDVNDQQSLDDVEYALSEDFENIISSLETEWEELKGVVDSYNSYIENIEKIEGFYDKVNKTNTQMCIMMYEYALKYADIIMSTNESADDMYDAFDKIYDSVYDDAGDDLYDEIYDGLFDEMYDSFYDGIIDDAYDTVPYKDWSKIHSNEYDMWSDSRSDVYDNWSDARSDIYDFWSDVRGDLWDNDMEDAKERIEDFRNDISKIKNS